MPPAAGAVPALRLALPLAGVVVYALLAHWLMVHAADRPWAVAVLFGPLLAGFAGVAARQRRYTRLLLAAALAALLAAIVVRGGLGGVERLYVAQHAGIHALLGAACLASLRPGRLSWIGQAALRVHGRLTPPMVAYAASVTRVWAGYFLGMAALSLAVHAAGAWTSWSLLANVLTPLAIAALVVGEHLLRYRLHPDFERASLADVAAAFGGPAARSAGATPAEAAAAPRVGAAPGRDDGGPLDPARGRASAP